ncbi:tight adherence protein B [Microbacterium imperiale]|uniref:Type II secretion system protein GspF domain-containing protein n=1 Tax=Microbacterium imperiale TaxID=33884 RepID=A0A9W6HHD7_9MICO|nr:type II secretion system F family protein [Microbacterium imperiale]MBP2421970.1 tight adherence protein B [Microbacterium imperiale]BFE39277.1 hypothetical protein GCM10017544_02330 [Microbacterium imperiale]GLJ79857.1 hypothetical protein GCM10017586_15390 [Microbacterium imperiale]
MRRLRRRTTDAAAATASSVAPSLRRLAVLLEAGVAPDLAWQHLAAAGDAAAVVVCAGRTSGNDLVAAIGASGGAWRDAAAAWQVAAVVGAPLARTLRSIAAALSEAEQTRDDVRVALAEPAATARLVSWLPLVAVVLALVLGFDIVATVTHPIGAVCLAAGAFLMAAAHVWTRRLVARAQPDGTVAGLTSEMLAIALSGGVSIARAEQVLASVDTEPTAADREVLELSRTAGAPAVELLRATADLERHRARVDGRLRAARLSSRLLLPLGVCTLPAFLLIGVAPMLLSVLASTPLTL